MEFLRPCLSHPTGIKTSIIQKNVINPNKTNNYALRECKIHTDTDI